MKKRPSAIGPSAPDFKSQLKITSIFEIFQARPISAGKSDRVITPSLPSDIQFCIFLSVSGSGFRIGPISS